LWSSSPSDKRIDASGARPTENGAGGALNDNDRFIRGIRAARDPDEHEISTI
jgi:hypothetical protein